MTRVLVVHATRNGSTREVAEEIAATLGADVMAADDAGDLSGYDAVVLGGALYRGKLLKPARRFLARHEDALASRQVAVFALGPRTLEPSDVASSRAQLDRALAPAWRVKPVSVAIFGGVVRPDALRFPFNRMEASDVRDWDAIRAWARKLATEFAGAEVAYR